MTKQERVAMGHRLRQQRTLLGLTREEFAELADISAGYYGQIEVGTSQMSIDTLIKLSRSSRLSMEYILYFQEYPQCAYMHSRPHTGYKLYSFFRSFLYSLIIL